MKTIVEQVASGGTREATAEYAQGLRDTPELCGSGFMCYYRDAVPTGRGPRSPAGCSPSGP